METLGRRLKRAREAKKKTQAEICRILGISIGTLSGYERDYREPDADTLRRLAEIYDVSTDYLFGLTDDPHGQIIESEPKSSPTHPRHECIESEFVRIPVLGFIKAGYDLYADQQVIDYEIIDKKSVDDGEYFYLIVTGDSMIEEGIRPGMRVLAKRQDYVDQGKIGVVLVNGEEATLKRVYYRRDGKIMLKPANKNIPTMVFPASEVQIQGQVKKVEWDV